MNFDDMKVIWDSQNVEPHYAVNEKGLHALLRTKSEKLRKLIWWQEIQTYGSSTFMVGIISALLIIHWTGLINQVSTKWVGLTQWDVVALILAAAGWLYFGSSIYLNRKQQQRRAAEYTSSLRDELERDIEQVDYEITSRKHIVRGFIPPYTGGILFIWVFFRVSGLPDWPIIPFIVFMIGALVFESRSQQTLVDRELVPRKLDLESLREKLNSAEA